MRLIDVYPYRILDHEAIQYLILKRSPESQYAGQWRMVAGKIEEGEQAWQAGLRELEEETGLQPELFWVIPSINHFYNHRHDRIESIPAFAAKVSGGKQIILNREHVEHRWITAEEVNEYVGWPEQRRLVAILDSILMEHKILDDWKISI